MTSFNGRAGAVLPQVGDYTAAQIATSNFRGTYYVDPNYVGAVPSNGSQANPYTTIAAAFAAGTVATPAGGIVYLPPKTTIVENPVFPTTGSWEIAGLGDGLADRSAITGNVTCTSVAQALFTLSKVAVSGSLTGDATSASGNFLYLRDASIGGSLTLTRSGAGSWFADFIGSGSTFFAFGGFILGACSVAGQLLAQDWYFGGAITTSVSNGPSFFVNCRLISGSFTIGAALAINFKECDLFAAMTITGAGTSLVSADGYTVSELMRVGVTLAGAVIKSLDSNQSDRRTLTNNFGPTVLALGLPGLYEALATITVLVPGTAGTFAVSVTYTDRTGALVTTALVLVAPVNVNAAAGTELRGSLVFSSNGATPISYTVSGIGIPGALSYDLGIALEFRGN